MKNRNRIKLFVAVFLFTGFISCKKENLKEYKTADLKNPLLPNGLPNITGMFNAYKYDDGSGVYVPLEIIDISYSEEKNEIIAMKKSGDKAVGTGRETFRGYYTNTFFDLKMNVWDGANYRTVDYYYIVIDNENSFTIYFTLLAHLKFIRRVEK